MRVEKDRPTSWKSRLGEGFGVKRMKTNLMGRGTSRALGMMMPSANRTSAEMGLSIDSREPTRTMVPSVPSLILLRMDCLFLASRMRSAWDRELSISSMSMATSPASFSLAISSGLAKVLALVRAERACMEDLRPIEAGWPSSWFTRD